MAQTYTRQSSFADGDTITAALFNDEYNQLVNAFAYSSSSASSTGHRHDGTAGQGGNIPQIGDLDFLNKIVVDDTNNRWGFYVEVSSAAVEQIRLQDGALLPVTDSDVDLGTSSLYFKDAYIDSITTTGNVAVGGNLTVTGTTTFNGGTLTLGDAADDNVVFGADVNSNIIPNTDNTYDLGSSSQEWKDLYIDGTANIDTLSADTAAIGDLTSGRVVLAGTSGELEDSANLTFDGSTLALTGAATVSTNLTVSGNTTLGNAATDTVTVTADVASNLIPSADSTYSLGDASNYWSHGYIDAITTTGNVSVGGNLTVTGTTTFNGGTLTLGDAADDNVVFGADVNSNIIPNTDNTYDLGSSSQEWKDLYVDGVAYLDEINFNGTAITSTAAELNILDGVTSTAAELNLLDGVTATTAELNILDGVTSTATELNIVDGNTSATSTTLADADRVVVNDGGTMVQVALTDFETYFESALDTLSNVTTVGALNAGSITSGFGAIDNGSSAITTTGTVTYGSLSDGTITITAFADEDDMSSDSATLVPTQQSVKAYVDSQVATANELSELTDVNITTPADASLLFYDTATSKWIDNVVSGDITIADTGVATIQANSVALGTDTTGDYVGTVTAGTGLTSTGATSGEGIAHSLSVDASQTQITAVGTLTTGTWNATSIADAYVDNNLTISGGTVDNSVIGGTTPAAGTFTTLTANTSITGTLSTAAQTNVTSVGTLSSLTVSGDVTVDTSTLKVDSTNNRVGIGNASPDVSLDLGSNTDAIHVPVGNTAARPGSPAAGYFRYNSETEKFEGYTTEWGAIAGGGSGTNMDTNIFTGDGSDTTFTLSTAPDDENNLMVFIDGVFQAQNVYSVSGTTLTFATAPANGRVITVYHSTTTVGGSNNSIATMTGDGSDTTLTLSVAPVHENNVSVYFDGVYQSKSNYSISGTTLTFSTAPPSGVAVEAITATNTSITTATQLSDADGDTLIQTEESSDEDKIRFDTGGTERVIIDSTGMGIGTSSPSSNLSVVGNSAAIQVNESSGGDLRLSVTGSTTRINGYSNHPMLFSTNNTERMRIDSSGNVGIGTSSPTNTLHTSGTGVQRIQLDATDNNAAGAGLYMRVLNSGSLVGNATIRVDNVGNIDFFNGTSSESQKMTILADGKVGIGTASPAKPLSVYAGDASGNVILTRAGTSENLTLGTYYITATSNDLQLASSAGIMTFSAGGGERMRIDSSGRVFIGGTSGSFGARLTLERDSYTIESRSSGTGSEGHVVFRNGNGAVGSIFTNASATAYNTSSDARLKEITGSARGLEVINALNPVAYNWKADGKADEGLIAQEVLDIVPNAVSGSEEEYYQMDYSKLVTPLVKAIQEQQTIIEDLKARIETLEG